MKQKTTIVSKAEGASDSESESEKNKLATQQDRNDMWKTMDSEFKMYAANPNLTKGNITDLKEKFQKLMSEEIKSTARNVGKKEKTRVLQVWNG